MASKMERIAMITKFKLVSENIAVGQKLPWPVYDYDGQQLLGQGEVLKNQKQLNHMIFLGAWYQAESSQTSYTASPQIGASSTMSSFEVVCNLMSKINRCFNLVQSAESDESFVHRLMNVVLDVQLACNNSHSAIIGSAQLITDAPRHLSHALQAAVIAEVAGQRMNLSLTERFSLVAAALTQNIGMIATTNTLFAQRESPSDVQQQAINNHPALSAAILESLGVTDTRWLNAVRQHHERVDGSGYPSALVGQTITVEARILGIIDEYIAISSHRSYRPPLVKGAALKYLCDERGRSIDTEMTELFLKVMGVFVPGSVVRLCSGELAIVLGHTTTVDNILVGMLTDTENNPHPKPIPNIEVSTEAVSKAVSPLDYRQIIDQAGDLWPRMRIL